MKKLFVKKITMLFCGFATALAVFGVISFPAKAEVLKQYEYEDFIYEKWGKKQAYIIDYVGDKTKLVIPTTLKGNEVVGIASLGDVKEVHFPDGMGIGVSYDEKLTKITVNESNERYIVKNNLVLSKDGTSLESCPGGIKNPKIPDSVEIFSDVAFSGGNITTLKLGKNVKELGDSTFSNCRKLKKVTFNKNIKTIGYATFSSCTALEKINLPQGLQSIGTEAFQYCTSLKKIQIPSKVKTIGSEAFRQCTSLKSIQIPSNVKSIGADAFVECENLKSIYIYNKNCKIKRGYGITTIPKTTTIYGYKGSTAEKYAERFGNKFVEIKKKK